MGPVWIGRAAKAAVLFLGDLGPKGGYAPAGPGESDPLGRELDRWVPTGDTRRLIKAIAKAVKDSLKGVPRREADRAAHIAAVAISRRSLRMNEFIDLGYDPDAATDQVLDAAENDVDPPLDPDYDASVRKVVHAAYTTLCAEITPELVAELG